MNDPMQNIERLSKIASREDIPEVNVSKNVLRRIRILRATDRQGEKPLLWFALGSACTATLTVLFCASLVNLLTDPLATLFQAFPPILF